MNRSGFTRLPTLILAVLLAGALAAQTATTGEEERLRKKVDRVSRQVAKLRQLELKRPVPLKIHSRDEIEKYVLDTLDKQCPPKQFAAAERAFKAFGLLPAGYELRKELVAIYREQIAGLYDPETRSMVLLRNNPFGGMQNMLLAHELTHALQDQHFNIKRMVDESSKSIDEDFTIMSVIEGGATSVMMDYAAAHPEPPDEDRVAAEGASEAASSEKLMNAPPLVKRSILGPYLSGLAFNRHFQSRGWKRIDAIFRDFPLSSEQIMHPEKYYPLRDFPTHIELKNPEDFVGTVAPGRNWKQAYKDVLGEIGVVALVETLGAILEDEDLARKANVIAAGWDGDRLVSFEAGQKSIAIIWVSTWDTPKDASEMANSLKKWVKWRQKTDTDGSGGVWRARVMRPLEEGKPGRDIICVAVRTPAENPRRITGFPAYTKKVIRSRSDMKNRSISQ